MTHSQHLFPSSRLRQDARMTELEPTGTRAIKSYHAHIYFRGASERNSALALRTQIGERFVVQLGRVHDAPVGPHSVAMYQVAFAREQFDKLVPWLMLNRRQLSVLVHPNTGRDLSDHLIHALWLGERLAIRDGVLSDDPDSDIISPIEPNTQPSRSGE
jgi:aromatic ring-cleaving dioxygenase